VTGSAPPAVPLFVRDDGHGAAILFLHGVGADHTVWNAVLPSLAPEFRLLVPDLRGHGRSEAGPEATYSLDAMVEDLVAVLDSRELDSAHVVGLSAGALLALRLGLERPERVRSLTMIAGAAYTDGHTRSVAERWAETYAADGPDALAIRMLKDLYYPDWIEAHMEVADRLREEVPRHDYRAAQLWAREVATFDERPRIASLRPPALIVQAMDDQVVDASHGRILRQSIPGSRIRILAETGHMVPIERPAETADAIREFVREVEAGRTARGPAGLSRPA
jgi:pimeloyl-ACP methyl ester carboxylesterase